MKSGTVAAKEKEKANDSLKREKLEAVKPEFKPQVRGLESRDLTLISKFEHRSFEHKRQEQLRDMFSNKNDLEQNRNNGLSR
jgi:hypothetical protein